MWLVDLRPHGERNCFSSKDAALGEAQFQRTRLRKEGLEGFEFTLDQRTDARAAIAVLTGSNLSLTQAAKIAMEFHSIRTTGIALDDAGNKGPGAISACRRWTRKFGGRWIRRRASSYLEFAGRRRSFHPRESRENNRPGGPQASRIDQSNNSWHIRSLKYQISKTPNWQASPNRLGWARPWPSQISKSGACARLANARGKLLRNAAA
jgi:hypothetical protein